MENPQSLLDIFEHVVAEQDKKGLISNGWAFACRVMVSASIAANTIVNSPMHHCSFLQTMQQKWDLHLWDPVRTPPPFTEVFTATQRNLDTWPDWKVYPGPSSAIEEALMRVVDPSEVPLNDLQKSIIDAISKFYAHDPALSGMVINTARDAKEFLERAEKLRHLSQPILS